MPVFVSFIFYSERSPWEYWCIIHRKDSGVYLSLFDAAFVYTWGDSNEHFLKKPITYEQKKITYEKNVQFICDAIVFSHVRTFCSHVKIENSMWKKPENVMCFHVPCFVENCKHQAQNHIWMSVDHMFGFQLTCENSWSHENSMINSSPRFPLSFMCLYGYFWIYKANQASWLRIICSPSHFQHKRKPDSRYSLS